MYFQTIPNFSNVTLSFQFPDWSGNGSGNFQFPGPQRVDLEIVFIFSVDSSRVDAISGLLCSLVTAWKPKVANFFFRGGSTRTIRRIPVDMWHVTHTTFCCSLGPCYFISQATFYWERHAFRPYKFSIAIASSRAVMKWTAHDRDKHDF